jgi:hypothetical protein
MRPWSWLLALVVGTLCLGALAPGCSDDETHVTFIGPIDASPDPPRLGRPVTDGGAD